MVPSRHDNDEGRGRRVDESSMFPGGGMLCVHGCSHLRVR